MAASTQSKLAASDDSSSGEDEVLSRCQEAVWEAQPKKPKDEENNVKESKRVVVSDHDHDGNELQVTKGFQSHVAKKLGHFLDSCISEMQPKLTCSVESEKCDDDDDEGFHLFSTSVPGQKVDEPPPPARRRPAPSSSDSDSEMNARLREAAVSVQDLLPSSTLSSTFTPPSTETSCSEKMEKKKKKKSAGEEEESHAVKRKKKRRQDREEHHQMNSTGSAQTSQSNGEHGSLELEQVKVKRKKKKKQERRSEEKNLD